MSRFRALYRLIDSHQNLRSSQASHSLESHSRPSIPPKIEDRIGPEIVYKKRDLSSLFVASEAPRSNRSAECRDRERRSQDNVPERESERGKPARKELSPDMVMFVNHLYEEGYFRYMNFLPDDKLVLSYFEQRRGRNFLKDAAERFATDKQEIAKWLSGSNLRKVALFGCPSTAGKVVFTAKRLRKYFGILEQTVCCRCSLRDSCKYVNQVAPGDANNLNLAVVINVITQYALDEVPDQLQIPEDIKASVSHLLKEILKLCPTVKRRWS